MREKLILLILSLVGAFSLYVLAIERGEKVNAVWFLVATLCAFTIGYRYYSRFIAYKVFQVDDSNPTPAHKFYNKVDFVPTNKWVLFAHQFASISGAGPLVGPVLAAQMGYLPGLLWILIGVVLAGAVQDMVVLAMSMRKDAKSLGQIAKEELGKLGGIVVLLTIFSILIILLAVLALVIVKAMFNSPWSTFTVFASIPIAILMGLYMWYVRPGSALIPFLFGATSLLLSLYIGRLVADSPTLSVYFNLSEKTLAFFLMAYGFTASVLPVWLLLVPRDYLSTFLKLGTVVLVAIGVLVAMPEVKMPALTQFAFNGNGPVWKGDLFPFLFITIACGAISGFHSLISSGTTPKLIDKESHIRLVGYGGMLAESFVAVIALIAAVSMEPGLYFAINSPPSVIGKTFEQAASVISSWGFPITAEELKRYSQEVHENILSRTGGAPSFAIGIAYILAKSTSEALIAFWYHFAILFEAMFILTTIDAGTRVGKYILMDILSYVHPSFKNYSNPILNIFVSFVVVALWGYFLYAGVVDPYGGVKTLWPLFGVSNQLLATAALIIATYYIATRHGIRYAWVTGLPALFVGINTITAGLEKVFHPDKGIGFLAHARWISSFLQKGELPSGINSMDVAHKVLLGDYINATLAFTYVSLVVLVALISLYKVFKHLQKV
ncbi:carbon starvation CstA family protein [Thermocrinis minervae]|uniref:Carbon starvation protein n=1 Tax=Thermocrinis minervae TaxID=381751 RepID=A0A1M6Q2U3_9AQUI|nr:carbon starvation CstA family protein [Thermocrinis minervae]SHK14535.1 carbon starvation protein [Thermocrinis minervae]